MKYEVIVSDLGTMYQGADYAEAQRIYEDYALRSSKPYGRMANKQVMLIDGNTVEVAIGADRYRLPATVKGVPAKP